MNKKLTVPVITFNGQTFDLSNKDQRKNFLRNLKKSLEEFKETFTSKEPASLLGTRLIESIQTKVKELVEPLKQTLQNLMKQFRKSIKRNLQNVFHKIDILEKELQIA